VSNAKPREIEGAQRGEDPGRACCGRRSLALACPSAETVARNPRFALPKPIPAAPISLSRHRFLRSRAENPQNQQAKPRTQIAAATLQEESHKITKEKSRHTKSHKKNQERRRQERRGGARPPPGCRPFPPPLPPPPSGKADPSAAASIDDGVDRGGDGGVRISGAVDGEESTTKKPSEKANGGGRTAGRVGKCCESKSM
jgi:hypothetical protein